MNTTVNVTAGLLTAIVLGGLPARASTHTPPFDVPYGRRITTVVTPAKDERLLVVSAYFHSDSTRFDRREAGLTVNGRILPAAALLSPAAVLKPRTPDFRFPRVDDQRQLIWFPWTHRPGGLADFCPLEHHRFDHYQIRGSQFRDFNETVVIDRDAFPEPADGQYRLTVYNNAARPYGQAHGRESGPLLKVMAVHAAKENPVLDRGPYVVPIWLVLAKSPALEQEARRKLDHKDTPAIVRARIAFQLALLEAAAGNTEAATTLLRTATAVESPYPERNEAVFRLAIHDPASAPDRLDETDDPFGWARLFNAWQAARRGENGTAIVNVLPIKDLPASASDAASRLRDGAAPLPVAHPVPERVGDADSLNTAVFRYSDQALLVSMRGPGTDILRPGNMPGENRPVWEYNCFELFLVPGLDLLDYFELNVSSSNARYDGKTRYHRHTPADWNGTWQSTASTDNGIMDVVYRIPWSDLGIAAAPPAGSLWIANVIRVQHLPGEPDGWKIAEFSLGPLTVRDFHRLQDGIILRFQ